MVLLLVFMQLTRDLFAIAKFLFIPDNKVLLVFAFTNYRGLSVNVCCGFYNSGVQTDITLNSMESMETGREILKQKLQEKTWSVNKIKDDDKATKFYTGLPSFAIFVWLFRLIQHQ